ncbi:MAG: hypothetical protein M1816_002225 [Peltula sp. TS41687]|nr:MAG: hypothetical protein M1816_002225 [Peltula sp. TS41687]
MAASGGFWIVPWMLENAILCARRLESLAGKGSGWNTTTEGSVDAVLNLGEAAMRFERLHRPVQRLPDDISDARSVLSGGQTQLSSNKSNQKGRTPVVDVPARQKILNLVHGIERHPYKPFTQAGLQDECGGATWNEIMEAERLF